MPDLPSTMDGAVHTIGTCTMESSGALLLTVRTLSEPGGPLRDVTLKFPVGHPLYFKLVDHVGPIKPGQTRCVLPWPEGYFQEGILPDKTH